MRSMDIRVELPEGARVTPAQRKSAELAAREAAVLDLYSSAAIGGYHAARLLNMGYYDFLDLLASKGIPASKTEPQPDQVHEAKSRLECPDKQP